MSNSTGAQWLVDAVGPRAAAVLPTAAMGAVCYAHSEARAHRRGVAWTNNVTEGMDRYAAVTYALDAAEIPGAKTLRPSNAFVLTWRGGRTWLYPIKYGDGARPSLEGLTVTCAPVLDRVPRAGLGGTPSLFPDHEFDVPQTQTVLALAYTIAPVVRARLGIVSIDPTGVLVWGLYLDLVPDADQQGDDSAGGAAVAIGDGGGDRPPLPPFLATDEPEIDLGFDGDNDSR